MKTSLILIGIASVVTSQLALGSVVSDQVLGEKYISSYKPHAADAYDRYYLNFESAACKQSSADVSYSLSTSVDRLLMISGIQTTLPYTSAFVDKTTEHYGLWEGSWTGCRLNSEKASNYITAATYSNWNAGLILDNMTTDGIGIEARYYIQSPDLAKKLASGSDTYYAYLTLKLNSCLTNRGETINSFSHVDADPENVREMISALRNRGYRSLLKCDITVSGKNTVTDNFTDGTTLRDLNGTLSLGVFNSQPDKLFLSGSSTEPVLDTLSRASAPRDAAKEQLAIQSAKAFISMIVNDYANLLYSLNDKRISIAQRNEAIRAYFENNGGKIRELLGTIDANYSDVSLMNKVSMMISIKDCYQTIAKVEQSITDSSPISLDQVIHQN